MRMSLVVKGVEKSPTLDRLLEHKLHYAFDQFGRWISEVALAIEDLNGPKGGIDKRCRVAISIPRHKSVVIDGRGADLFAVVANVIDRAAQAMSRLRERRQARRRGAN